MLMNPETEKDFETSFKQALRADPEVFVIGGHADGKASAFIEDAVKTGHTVFTEVPRINAQVMALLPIREAFPAEYAYCRDLVLEQPGSRLPRSVRRKIGFPKKAIGINYPSKEGK